VLAFFATLWWYGEFFFVLTHEEGRAQRIALLVTVGLALYLWAKRRGRRLTAQGDARRAELARHAAEKGERAQLRRSRR
jgi:hypothetical protein